MPRVTLSVDCAGQILTWSEDAERLLGYTKLEAAGKSVKTIIPPHLRRRHEAGFQRFVQTGHSRLPEIVTTPALHKSGAIVRLQISVRAVYGEDGKIIAVEAIMKPHEIENDAPSIASVARPRPPRTGRSSA
jgi:PAS domain S-box-containing protein